MAREIATLLARIFAERRKAGRTDLEAIETALRDGLHQLGTVVLTGLLQGDIPPVEQLPTEWQFRGLLGGTPCLILTFMSHTPCAGCLNVFGISDGNRSLTVAAR